MEQLTELAKQGPAWALLIFAIGTIGYLFRQLTKEREQCGKDWRDTVGGTNIVLKEWQLANDTRTRALDANVRALELMAEGLNQLKAEISNMKAEFQQLKDKADQAMASHRQTREALLKRGLDL